MTGVSAGGGRLLVLAAALAYAAFIYQHGWPLGTGSDSPGYLNSARLLAQGELPAGVHPLPALSHEPWDEAWQQPLGFTMQPGSKCLRPA